MPKLAQIIVLVTSLALIVSGLIVILIGLSRVTDNKPNNVVSEINDYYFYHGQIQTVFYVKTDTIGAFMASNPINISITTNGMNVKGIQLEFLGASRYFPNNTAPPSAPNSSSWQDWAQYGQAMQEWANAINQNLAKIHENILLLTNDTNLTWSIPFENITIPNYPTFSGEFQNLTYNVGGDFSIGVTVTQSDGNVVGYGLGDTSYIIDNAITISPPETLLQIESNNILTGLGWIGIGVSPLIAGLAILVEFVKPYTTPTRRRVYDGDWE